MTSPSDLRRRGRCEGDAIVDESIREWKGVEVRFRIDAMHEGTTLNAIASGSAVYTVDDAAFRVGNVGDGAGRCRDDEMGKMKDLDEP